MTAGAPEGIDHELQQEQAETGSRPRTEIDAIAADLGLRRKLLPERAESSGVRVAGLATSPLGTQLTPTDDER